MDQEPGSTTSVSSSKDSAIKRQRRTKEEVQADKDRRDRLRRAKNEKLIAQRKESERREFLMQGKMDIAGGNRHTEAAKAALAERDRIRANRDANWRNSDPLALQPQNKRKAELEAKAAEKGKKKQKPGPNDLRDTTFYDEHLNQIRTQQRGFSFRGYQKQHVDAADRFQRDWRTAYGGQIKSASFTPKVDGGPTAHAAHGHRVDCQHRMAKMREKLGERYWLVTVAAVIYGIGPAEIAKIDPSIRHVNVTWEIKGALEAVSAFYNSSRRRRDPLIDVITKMIASGERESDLSSPRRQQA